MAPVQLSRSLWTRPHFPHLVPLIHLWLSLLFPISSFDVLMTFPQPVGMWTPMRFWQLTLDCFSREPHRRCSHQEHPESCRRHTPELGDVDKDPSTICPYDSGLFNVLRGSVCQMAQHIPCLLPGQRIHISRSPKKSPPRHRRMCPRNQPLVHPVWRKEFNVRPLRYSNILCMMTIFWNGSCFRYLIFIFIIVCH